MSEIKLDDAIKVHREALELLRKSIKHTCGCTCQDCRDRCPRCVGEKIIMLAMAELSRLAQ